MKRTDPRPAGASRPRPNPHRPPRPLNGRNPMYRETSLARVIHAERAARWAAEAEVPRLLDRPPRRPVRQAIGRSMLRIGARLLAEQPLDTARSR
jgi:hypothetical protein